MRYLSKTYLGDAASVPTTSLDSMWYNGSAFGIRSSALGDKLYAIWGYDVDYESIDSADFQAWSNQPTNLLGTGISRTLWHSNSMNGAAGLWRDTNYFFGLTHETLLDNVNIIHAYHRYNSIDDIIQCTDNDGEYSSSMILWMWDVKHYDPIKSTYSTLQHDNTWEYVARHYIYNSGNVRPQWKAHTNIYDSIETFSIYTVESGCPAGVENDNNKYITSSIHYLIGTMDRSFNGYYTSHDVGRDDIGWRDGMSLFTWDVHENAEPMATLRPENSMLGMIRSSKDNIDIGNVHEYREIFSYLGCPGKKTCSPTISARFVYSHDNTAGVNDDTFLYSHTVLRVFNVHQVSGIVDQDGVNIMPKFITNEDINIFNSHNDFEDSGTEWYQFIII